MSMMVTLPELGKSKASAKDLVISILSREHPLALAKIHGISKRKFHSGITFQGIRKAVNLLLEEGVLVKYGKQYEISKEYIHKLRDLTEQLEQSYFSENKVQEVEALDENIKIYKFDNIIDLDIFWNRIIEKWFESNKKEGWKEHYVQQSGHTWYVLANLEEETKILEKIAKYKLKFYTLAIGDTPLDGWCKKYYEDQGFFYAVNKEKPTKDTSHYFAVYGDNILQTTYPEELNKEINQIYEKAKDFQSFDAAALIKVLRKKKELKVTLMKNPVVAEQLRKGILERF